MTKRIAEYIHNQLEEDQISKKAFHALSINPLTTPVGIY